MEALCQAYGLVTYHSNDETVIPDVVWSDFNNRESLIVSNQTVTRDDLSKSADLAVKSLENKIDRLLFGFKDVSFIPATIQDDYKKTTAGYSFLEDERNLSLRHGYNACLEHILKTSGLVKDGQFDRIQYDKWVAEADEALKILCFLIHTTCAARSCHRTCLSLVSKH